MPEERYPEDCEPLARYPAGRAPEGAPYRVEEVGRCGGRRSDIGPISLNVKCGVLIIIHGIPPKINLISGGMEPDMDDRAKKTWQKRYFPATESAGMSSEGLAKALAEGAENFTSPPTASTLFSSSKKLPASVIWFTDPAILPFSTR